MLEDLDAVDWSSFPAPPEHVAVNVPAAIRGLVHRGGPERSNGDYALYAFGNNHRGTYYPVIVAVLPFLGKILTEGEREARSATLAVLCDLCYFSPEPEFSVTVTKEGRATELTTEFARQVVQLRPTLEMIAASDPTHHHIAQDILDRIWEITKEESKR